MNFLRLISRFLLGIVFIFSGFVKAVDPYGYTFKIIDYLHAFHLDFLVNLSMPAAIFISAIELVLGVVLIMGYQRKIAYWFLLFFMSFFTILTFILALTNPVSDCGCFGDALILTNWQTFFKNVVIMVFVVVLFNARNAAYMGLRPWLEYVIILGFFSFSFLLSVQCIKHLPILDFRPYSVGTYIPDAMIIPEGAPQDVYETVLFYKNNETGEEEAFSIENYPQDTVAYTFITSESKLITKGYEPPIHDFALSDPEGIDVTDRILEDPDYSLLMVSYNLKEAETNALQKGNIWKELEMLADDLSFIPVTSTSGQALIETKADLGLAYDFYSADEIMIKTTVRSNPGFILLKNGTIMHKWSYRDFPTVTEWNKEWPDLIEQYQEEKDPEILQLIEEGFMEDFGADIIDFDKTANTICSSSAEATNDKVVWMAFMLFVVSMMLSLRYIPKKNKSN